MPSVHSSLPDRLSVVFVYLPLYTITNTQQSLHYNNLVPILSSRQQVFNAEFKIRVIILAKQEVEWSPIDQAFNHEDLVLEPAWSSKENLNPPSPSFKLP